MVWPCTLSLRFAEPTARFQYRRWRGVIENHDRGIVGEQARDGDALLLPARERHPALADDGVQPARQRGDVAVEPATCAASVDLLRAASTRPKAILRASVSENSVGSCGTTPIARRSAPSRNLADVAAVEQYASGRSAR